MKNNLTLVFVVLRKFFVSTSGAATKYREGALFLANVYYDLNHGSNALSC